MQVNPFIHLRVRSEYSLCESVIKIPDLIDSCRHFKMPAVAITDSNNLFGALEFSKKAASGGIQPILGAQVNVVFSAEHDHKDLTNLPLYAKSELGYHNLIQIVTEASLHSCSKHFPCVTKDILGQYSEDLLVMTGGIEGYFAKQLLNGNKDEAIAHLSWLAEVFSDRLYIELQRHHIEQENAIEEDVINIAYDKNIPLIATNNVCFLKSDYQEAHDVLLAIGRGTTVNAPEMIHTSPEYYLKSPKEMEKLFQDIPEAYNNTSIFARRCAFMLTPQKPIMPTVHLEGSLNQDQQLEKLSSEGLAKRLDKFKNDKGYESKIEQYNSRLQYELDMIRKMGYSGYFLIVHDYVNWAKQNGIPVGPGRGSVAGSVVAWALTISDVDPIRFQLFFERFLNPERISMPDIDIDFCQLRRDEVIEYVKRCYGEECVAHIITFGKLQARAVIKDAGRALSLPYGLTDKIAKSIPFVPSRPVTLAEAVVSEAALKDMIKDDVQIQHLVEIALKLEGVSKHTSVHAAGIIISNDRIRDVVPLYKDPKTEITVTQFSMKYIEDAGLIKFDFLGLKTLTVIQHVIDLLKKRGVEVDISDIPLDDKKTFDALKNVDCVGVFQLDSSGMRDVVRKLQPDRIEDIIALVALYRPGPMDDIPKYIACKHDPSKVTYLHEKLQPILSETYGVMVYQEQVMQIAQVIGGYTMGQADILRRAMGKKDRDEMKAQRVKFVNGAKQQKINNEIAEQLFDLMSKFASYGFNKSHSTPYGLITYQTAYLKANYLLEFYAAAMTLDSESTDKILAYYNDLKEHNVNVILPDVNMSGADFNIDYVTGSIIYSLSALKGTGRGAAELVEVERAENGKFVSIFDFVERMNKHKIINRRILEAFIKSGAFDSLHPNRKQLFYLIDTLLAMETDPNQGMLFEKVDPPLPQVGSWSLSEKLHNELEAVSFYLSAHPLEEQGIRLASMDITPIKDIQLYSKCRIAGVVVSVQRKKTKNDSTLGIIMVSDPTGNMELTLFSELFFKYIDILQPGTIIIADISVSQLGDRSRISVEKIYEMSANLKLQPINKMETIPLEEHDMEVQINILSDGDLKKVHSFLASLPVGRCRIRLAIPSENTKILLHDRYKILDIKLFQDVFGEENICLKH